MRLSLWFLGTAYALFSAVFWYVLGQAVSLVPPMMLADADAIRETLLRLSIALLIYSVVSLLFFRTLARSRAN